MSLKEEIRRAVRKFEQHCKCYKKKKNGTDICWKQILNNNQNRCKSIVFFFHTGTWTWNNRDFEIYGELAYNRKNSLCTAHTHKQQGPTAKLVTHNLEACISILEVIAHPEGVKIIDATCSGFSFSTQNTPTLTPPIIVLPYTQL